MHAPTDNIIKSAIIPDQVIKLKSTVKDEIDVTKTEFDKELQDKFKTTIKDVESFEHKPSEDAATAAQQIDEKIQYDSIVTEKPFKKEVEQVVEQVSHVEFTPSKLKSDIDVTRQFLEQEHKSEPISSEQLINEPDDEKYETSNVMTTTTTTTIRSTKDFLDSELAALHEPDTAVVTNYFVEEFEGPDNVKTITKTTKTTTSTTEWSEPIEIHEVLDATNADGNNVKTTVHVTKEFFHGDPGDTDEFYKTFEEKITKKMSQDFSIHKDDNIADGMFCQNISRRKFRKIFKFSSFQYQTKF